MSKKLVLIDGHSILNRAFYGLPDLTNSIGQHTNAVYGFLNILFRILEEEKPDYLAVAFDVHAKTFRHELYEAYKGTRKPMPEELREQVPMLKEVLSAMQITILEQPGLEADDILGTLAKKAEKAGMEVALISGDRDLLQIASDRIKIRIPKTKMGKTEIEDYYAKDVLSAWQVTPEQFIELKALMGDTADNIPGVPKVGEKTAKELMVTYGSLEQIYVHLDEIPKKSIRESLAQNRELAELSKVLATIKTDAEPELDYEKAVADGYFTKQAYELFKKLEFKNLLARFSFGQDDQKNGLPGNFRSLEKRQDLETVLMQANAEIGIQPLMEEGKILALAVSISDEENFFYISSYFANDNAGSNKRTVETDEGKESNRSVATETDGQMSLFDLPGMQTGGDSHPCDSGNVYTNGPFEKKENATAELAAFLRKYSAGHAISTFHIKPQYAFLDWETTDHYFDILIAAYLLYPLKSDHEPESIALEQLGMMLPSRTEIFGKKTLKEALEYDPDQVRSYLCTCAYVARKAAPVMREKLCAQKMDKVMHDIEMPLSVVLYDMEQAGVIVKRDELKRYGEALIERINELEKSICDQAGEAFNIQSPKQLGEILFEKMGLPGGKKTKTGYSTAAEVLEKLAPEHRIVREILEYRGLTKLKSTYADGLAAYIGEDERIHTNFNQTITATGRISSTEPNLQNIPMRMELGRKIRKVFVPAHGSVFLDADYSQIELRILAHMSGDSQLIEAYRMDQDIHRITASKVFHTPFEEVTDLQRRNAKAVNFGIVYGISSFGLSQDLSITPKEAAVYIQQYFETYPGIKKFLDGTVESAKQNGYSETMFGRRRPIPELKSSNFMQRSFGERIAMNSPIQGTAADIIKIAMIKVWRALREAGLKSRLILQVHDELIIEAPQEERDEAAKILEESMKSAADLAVKLEVEVHSGENWYDAK